MYLLNFFVKTCAEFHDAAQKHKACVEIREIFQYYLIL